MHVYCAGGLEGLPRQLAAAVRFVHRLPYAEREAVLVEGMLRTVVDSQVRHRDLLPSEHIKFDSRARCAEWEVVLVEGMLPAVARSQVRICNCFAIDNDFRMPYSRGEAVLVEGMLRAVAQSQVRL